MGDRARGDGGVTADVFVDGKRGGTGGGGTGGGGGGRSLLVKFKGTPHAQHHRPKPRSGERRWSRRLLSPVKIEGDEEEEDERGRTRELIQTYNKVAS